MSTDFANWSDEQLKQYMLTGEEPEQPGGGPGSLPVVAEAPPGKGAEALARRNLITRAASAGQRPAAETIEPSSTKRFLAGMGGKMLDTAMGVPEKFTTLFPGEGAAGDAELEALGQERSARRGALRQLEETTAGQAGSTAADVAAFAAAPSRIPAQMGTAAILGFLRGGPDKPKGAINEMTTSAVSGGIDAATTGLLMKGADLLGRTLNAARGNYTEEGKKLLQTDKAAQALGLKGEEALGLGQLAPNSPFGRIERNLPGYSERVAQQGETVRKALSSTKQVPQAQGSGMVAQEIPGGKLSDEMKAAVAERYKQARAKYSAVDQFAQANGLGNVETIYSTPQLLRLQKNALKADEGSLLAVNLINHYDPYALTTVGNNLTSGMTSQQLKQAGIPLTEYHDLRVAINKGINSIDRIEMAKRTTAQMDAYRYLMNLKEGLDNEVDIWAKKSLKTKEAVDLYKNAKQFYADVVAPSVIQNPLARKVVSRTRGYNTGDQLVADVAAPRNRELVDRLEPTLRPEGLDMVRLLQGVPDVAQAAAGRGAPQIEKGNLARVASAALGHPGVGALEMLPGLGPLARSGMAKRMFAAKSPLEQPVVGPLTAAAVQAAPQPGFEKRVRKLLGLQ